MHVSRAHLVFQSCTRQPEDFNAFIRPTVKPLRVVLPAGDRVSIYSSGDIVFQLPEVFLHRRQLLGNEAVTLCI